MYAIIQTGGKQYRCSPEDVLSVERLEGEVGKTFTFKEVLLATDGKRVEIGAPLVKGAQVVCEILGEKKGKKVTAFSFRRRKDSMKKRGHRQIKSQVRVKEIKF